MSAATHKRKVPIVVWQALLGAVFVALWQFLVDSGSMDKFFFSRPTDILQRIWQWVTSGTVWMHLSVTLTEAALSFAIGVAFGVGLGFLLARVEWLAALLDPYIRIANALPRVVLAPIFLLWFGLGIWSKVALGVTVVFFIVFFNTYQGVRDVDRVLLNNARMLGANERQLMRHVLIPSALTWIFSSLHISIGFAIIAVVVGEYLGASRGVGYVISQAEGVFDTTGVFAGMAVLATVVLVVGAMVNRLERWLLRWKPEREPAGQTIA
ncbi:MAG TPA: ABC transporter permease [Bryobacteraceae bacterium]|nr:ABC transporter permease [Bryobacteraceae bacterium]